MVILELFLSFMKIGLFSIGGGYAAMPLIEEQAVEIHGWLKRDFPKHLITRECLTHFLYVKYHSLLL